MQAQVLRENLVKAVSIANRVIETKPNLPVLSNLLLTAGGSQIVIESSNLETSMRIRVRAKIESEGKVTLPARKFLDYLNTLTDSRLSLTQEETKLVVKSEAAAAEFVTLPADDFPTLPTLGEARQTLPSREFARLIAKTTFAASKDEVRPVLTGVLLKTTPDGLAAVATDGFRLSEVKIAWEDKKLGQLKPMIIPAKALQEIERVLDERAIELGLSGDANQVIFTLGGVQIITRLLEAEYPNYQQIIPTDYAVEAVFSTEEMINQVKLASIFARREGQTVRLFFDSQTSQLKLRARSAEVGEHESSLSGSVQGAAMEVGFNAAYLLEGLNSIGSAKVRIKLGQAQGAQVAPVTFVPEEEKESNLNYLHIIMPVRLEE